jgi:hypothetical protein
MATNTTWAISLLDEAAAIVEAEWTRLQQDEALWEREIAGLLCEMRAPRPRRRVSASPPPGAGGQVNRCQTAVAAGRRGAGPQAGMGYPAVSSVRPGNPTETHCRTREVMPTVDSPAGNDARVAHNDPDSASPRPTPASRVGLRTPRHSWWHCEVDRVPRRCHARAGGRRAPRPALAGRPGVPHNKHQ